MKRITVLLMMLSCMMLGVVYADNSERIAEIKTELKQLYAGRIDARRGGRADEAYAKEQKLRKELDELKSADAKAKAEAQKKTEDAANTELDAQKAAFEKELGTQLEQYNLSAYTKVSKGKTYFYTYNKKHRFSSKSYLEIYQVLTDGKVIVVNHDNKIKPLFCIVDPDGDYVDGDELTDGIYRCTGVFNGGIISLRLLEKVKIAIPEGLIEKLDARNNEIKYNTNRWHSN